MARNNQIFKFGGITILNDEACPGCGAFWGHPDPELDFPNRPKVHDSEGDWFRCYNPNCKIGYYTQEGLTELALSPEAEAEMKERIRAQYANVTFTQTSDNTWKVNPQ